MVKDAAIHLILGGARSGKSSRAEQLGLALEADRHLYVATAQAFDDEMADRIAKHQESRDPRWETAEEPLDLVALLRVERQAETVILVDCLTLWLSNLLMKDLDAEDEASRLVAALDEGQGTVLFVSNEVGLGLVPDNALGRRFRDAQGRLNQQVAAIADHVEFMVSGIPMAVKSPAP